MAKRAQGTGTAIEPAWLARSRDEIRTDPPGSAKPPFDIFGGTVTLHAQFECFQAARSERIGSDEFMALEASLGANASGSSKLA